ncbi:MAG TPA: translocation/assembly module TamB domain-containing protein [Caulobacterales bacterium]|nr:translocation/assembly module TamB domain-containing protein [Caulobacterales bacterium]
MSDRASTARRFWRAHRVALAVGAAAIAGGAGFAIGPGASWIVDHGADGRKVWRLGTLKIDGVTGSWMGDLHARRVSLQDEAGVWVEADDVALRWRPLDLLRGAFTMDAGSIGALSVIRRPLLEPPTSSTGANYDLHIGALHVERVALAQPVLGAPSTFRFDFGMDRQDQELHRLDVDLMRLDSAGDHAIAHYRHDGAVALHVDVLSEKDGAIARLLGVADDGVRITADGAGDADAGAGQFLADAGPQHIGGGTWMWRATDWRMAGELQLDVLPGLRDLSERVGSTLAVRAGGARHGRFTAHAQTPFITADLAGVLDQQLALTGPARLVAQTNRLSDIAHESPVALGAARFEGTLRHENERFVLAGAFDARDVAVIGRRANFNGPVQAQLDPNRFSLSADLAALSESSPLFANARLRTTLDFNRRTSRFTLSSARLEGDAVAADARGWANRGDGEFDGQWRVRKLDAVFDGLRGEAGGAWRAQSQRVAANRRVWSATFQGQGADVGGSPPIAAQLLGRRPTLDATLRFENDGVTVHHAHVDGDKIRAAAAGRIVHGVANLQLEASGRGPLTIGDATITGVVDATGSLTGDIGRPTLAMDARLAGINAVGVDIVEPVVQFTLAPRGATYAGRGSIQGTVQGQAATAESDLVVASNGVTLPTLRARAGALEASGTAHVGPRGVDAQLALNGRVDNLAPGLTGGVRGSVALSPDSVNFDTQFADATLGDLRLRAATLSGAGPYRAITVRYALRGRLRQAPLAFEGHGVIANEHGVEARLEGTGALAGAAIASRAPAVLRWPQHGMEATFDVALGDGALVGRWSDTGRSVTGEARIEHAPLQPIGAVWGERASGALSGHFLLTSTGAGLSGNADVTFNDARLAGRQRGNLDTHIIAQLQPTRLQATVDAQSSDGLQAHFEADAPVVTSSAPLRVALTPERRGQAQWSVHGPVDALWNLARLENQDLQGVVDGEGRLSFGEGYLSGDGEVSIQNGRFEDKFTGVKMQDLRARVLIHDDGVRIDTFTATDGRGGVLTATGGSANARDGRIEAQLRNFRLIDRPDANAQANGALTLEWQGLESKLSGELNLIEANVNIAARAEAGIPELDVVEINRPGEDYGLDTPKPAPLHPTDIDVRVRADERVFTRGRGVEAEWALDLRLDGTSANPQIFGEARAVRGTLALSGEPFEIQDGVITFNGAAENARVNLTAERVTPDLTARINLAGTATNPDITLSSDPALPEDEILPQVLFGRSVADLSALEAAQLAASLAQLSGQSSFNLMDAARAAVGLDRFSVRQDESGGLLVAGGVYLMRNVYVEVARTGMGQAQTRVEWTLRPKLVLITSFLANGDQRVSVRWRRESN